MENKEIKQDAIRNKLILSSILCIWLLIWLFVYFVPWFKEVWQIKAQLWTEIQTFEKYEKSWLDYNEYLTLSKNEQIKKILQNDKDFFLNNLTNTQSWKYIDFLNEKEKNISKKLKDWVVEEREKSMYKILPSYTDWFAVEWNMTDLSFVNYIESLLRTFWLKTTSKIWIESLVPLDKDVKDIWTQIFYIPLKLDIVWRKADVVEFLYFLQNVWSTTLDDDNNLIVYKDKIVNKILIWDKKTPNYNIYENKIVDIENISIPNYIDTSTNIRPTSNWDINSFLNYIINWTEKNNEFRVSLSLKFYVRWLPTYKIELGIESTIKKYNEIAAEVKEVLSKLNNWDDIKITWSKQDVIATFKWLDKYLKDLEQSIKKLESWLRQKLEITKLYKDAYNLNYELTNLKQYVSSIKNENK